MVRKGSAVGMAVGVARTFEPGRAMDLTALIGTVAGVAGTAVGFLQWWDSRRSGPRSPAAATGAVPLLTEFTVLAPEARVRGHARPLVDRTAELHALRAGMRGHAPVLVVEGFSGVGKTALVAALCRLHARSHRVRWVFCAEKAQTLNLRSLALALSYDTELAGARELALVVGGSDAGGDRLQDALAAFLAANPVLLVLDDFHTVRDPALVAWARRTAHTEGRSTVVLTSRRHLREIPRTADTPWIELRGLAEQDARQLLVRCGLRLPDATLDAVWRRAGEGNPQALTLFAGQATLTRPEVLAVDLSAQRDDLNAWIGPIYDSLDPAQRTVLKAAAFVYEAAAPELVAELTGDDETPRLLAELEARFLLGRTEAGFELHSSVRDHVDARLTDEDRELFAARLTRWYRSRAREVFLDGLGADEPSYGLVYLESFPDYVAAEDRHIRLVDDLLDRLADTGRPLPAGARILVLGAGHGTHDAGFVKHGLDVTDLDIQPEIAALGERRALRLAGRVRYVVADMTRGLPDEVQEASMDAVFNIGSSFGYEDADDDNAAVFRTAAAALKPGAPFVFEYVNGPHWEHRRVQRQIDTTVLPDGAERTEYSITDPTTATSLTAVRLRRPDGSGGWFRHFMHYYRLPQVLAMMERAGLREEAVFGVRGGRVRGPFDEAESEAMVVIATRAQG